MKGIYRVRIELMVTERTPRKYLLDKTVNWQSSAPPTFQQLLEDAQRQAKEALQRKIHQKEDEIRSLKKLMEDL